MKLKLFFVVIAVAAGLLIWIFVSGTGTPMSDDVEPKVRKSAKIATVKDRAKSRSSAKNRKNRKGARSSKGELRKRLRAELADEFDDDEHPYSKEDRKIAKELQAVLDAVDLDENESRHGGLSSSGKRLLEVAVRAMKSANPSVRQRGVEACSCLGKDALAEMTPAMADPDPEVAEDAIDGVENALMDIDDQEELFTLSASYLSTFRANEDAITMLSGIMEGAALQIVESDDPDSVAHVARAAQNRSDVVDALTQMIDAGGKVAEAAKESFETITSQDWISADEAKLWAKDPENYEPPE